MSTKSSEDWPESELQYLGECPVCGSSARDVLYEGLIDNVFFVAPGRWTLFQCDGCKSAYLDPRPDEASIGKAYGVYYTHSNGAERDDVEQLRGIRYFRRVLANGYLNHRYGTNFHPASLIGFAVAHLIPMQRQALDIQFRYLPKPKAGQRLLDVGCGNGDFLVNARQAGWDVMGVEPDPSAAKVAQQRGLNVQAGMIDVLDHFSECFDAITLSHVIEHVHSPQEVLKAVHRLLKPGGVVYIDTPNIESTGSKRFGSNWRGLEAPRHLVIFTPDSLHLLLAKCGFSDVEFKKRTAVTHGMNWASAQIMMGKSPYASEMTSPSLLERLRYLFRLANTRQLEFVTLLAKKA